MGIHATAVDVTDRATKRGDSGKGRHMLGVSHEIHPTIFDLELRVTATVAVARSIGV